MNLPDKVPSTCGTCKYHNEDSFCEVLVVSKIKYFKRVKYTTIESDTSIDFNAPANINDDFRTFEANYIDVRKEDDHRSLFITPNNFSCRCYENEHLF